MQLDSATRRKPASWVIIDLDTGSALFETFSERTAQNADASPHYRAEPIGDYLVRINDAIRKGA